MQFQEIRIPGQEITERIIQLGNLVRPLEKILELFMEHISYVLF
jgi:hypothetical protein